MDLFRVGIELHLLAVEVVEKGITENLDQVIESFSGRDEARVTKDTVHTVSLLDGGQKLAFTTRVESGVERSYVVLPVREPDPIDTVIVIE